MDEVPRCHLLTPFQEGTPRGPSLLEISYSSGEITEIFREITEITREIIGITREITEITREIIEITCEITEITTITSEVMRNARAIILENHTPDQGQTLEASHKILDASKSSVHL